MIGADEILSDNLGLYVYMMMILPVISLVINNLPGWECFTQLK